MSEAIITVLLVDDHSLVRRGFRRMLEDEDEIRVWAKLATAMARWRRRPAAPGVVVMDFALPSMNGAVATRRILEVAA